MPTLATDSCPLCHHESTEHTGTDYTEYRCRSCGGVWNTARQILNESDLAELLAPGFDRGLQTGFEWRFPLIPLKVLRHDSTGVSVAIGHVEYTFVYPYSYYYIDEVIEDIWMEQVRQFFAGS